jgi:transposase
MAKKRYRPEEIIAKLREVEVLLAQGMKVPEVVKAIGIHEVTYYRWRKEFGGMKVSLIFPPESGPKEVLRFGPQSEEEEYGKEALPT